ncbi:MAG TPA: DNA adenine methylase [Ktedonosporobacter sp.]|jgi:DNA adenine methylase|nr:DNA adenine methylase [Ktedonosporobacter sp.]
MVARSPQDNEHQMINSPFKWVGGKSRLRKHIINLLPQHTCYVELFAGAAWVLFGKQPSNVEVLNDIDQDLVNFFRVVKEKPGELIASFEWELVSRAEFERLASLDPTQLTDVQRAHRFYYLIMASWGGEFHYPRFQTSINDGGHGNRLFGALQTLHKRIMPVYERLRTVIIENLDWQACVDRYDRPGTVMYIDPPYPENGCNYVYNMRDRSDHEKLADRLNHAQCKWLLSSYDTPFIRELFAEHHIIQVQSSSGMNTEKNGNTRVVNKEVLIMNYAHPNGANIPPAQSIQQNILLDVQAEAE